MRILAIDPSLNATNGVCIKESGQIVGVDKLDSLEVLKLIEIGYFNVVICEDPRLSGVFRQNTHRRVGRLDAVVKMYQKMAKKVSAKFISIKPQGLNRIANDSFPDDYKKYINRSEHEKVAILLHDLVNLENVNKKL